MTRTLFVWTFCSTLALAAFGVLLVEDRLLDVPLPYSLALAFASLLVLGSALLAVVERMRARRPVVIRVAPVVNAASAGATPDPAPRPIVRPRTAQGLVLLDFSSVRTSPERAA